MQFVHIDVTVSFPGVVDVVPVRDPPNQRAGISGERVQVEPVDACYEQLWSSDQSCGSRRIIENLHLRA